MIKNSETQRLEREILLAWSQCVANGETPTLENIGRRVGKVKSVILYHMRELELSGEMVSLHAGTSIVRMPAWVVAKAKEVADG